MRCAILASCLGAIAAVAAGGCRKSSQDGLPPATAWQAEAASAEETSAGGGPAALPPATPPPGMGGPRRNPHAGFAPGDPNDPHAGLDMNGDGEPDDPHAGLDMSGGGGGTDVTKLGLSPPDPDRPIDPNHRITGKLIAAPAVKDRLASGTSVFLVVKRAGADGAPSGPPLAVEMLGWTGSGMAFELGDTQAMVAGTELTGPVIVTARYDQDRDALTKQPGDVTGQARATIPADGVTLTLDTVLP